MGTIGQTISMQITVTTWNINSVRFRINLVAKFIKSVRPDILCLQETKCPDDSFPRKRFKRLGYEHIALNGQKGHHGVVVLSRLPFEASTIRDYGGKSDCRHIAVMLGEQAGLKDPITLHNFYVPAGGDIPDPALNPKFAHKLAFLDEMLQAKRCGRRRTTVPSSSAISTSRRSNATCGVISSFCQSSRTRRSNARSFSACRRPAAGSMRCARSCRSPRSSSLGGAIARPTGPNPTRAAVSTIFGHRICWLTAWRRSRLPKTIGARKGRPTTYR